MLQEEFEFEFQETPGLVVMGLDRLALQIDSSPLLQSIIFPIPLVIKDQGSRKLPYQKKIIINKREKTVEAQI